MNTLNSTQFFFCLKAIEIVLKRKGGTQAKSPNKKSHQGNYTNKEEPEKTGQRRFQLST